MQFVWFQSSQENKFEQEEQKEANKERDMQIQWKNRVKVNMYFLVGN